MLRFGRFLPGLVLLTGCIGSAVGTPPSGLVPSTIQQSPLASGTHCPTYGKGSLLSDGDFHEAKDPGGAYLTFSKGQRLAPQWKATKTNINFVGTMFWDFRHLCSVDLDGESSVGAIAHQGFATKKGASYTVSFLMSGNSFCGAAMKKMNVVAGNKTVLFKWNTTGGHSVQYGKVSARHFVFTASASTTTLDFKSLDAAGSGCGPVIGAVEVRKGV